MLSAQWQIFSNDFGLQDQPDLRLTSRLGHTSYDTIALLKSKFGEQVISRNDPVNWRVVHAI